MRIMTFLNMILIISLAVWCLLVYVWFCLLRLVIGIKVLWLWIRFYFVFNRPTDVLFDSILDCICGKLFTNCLKGGLVLFIICVGGHFSGYKLYWHLRLQGIQTSCSVHLQPLNRTLTVNYKVYLFRLRTFYEM